VQQKFRIRIGPVSLAVYERFLPTGTSFGKLVDWVRNYAGLEYRWDAQLVLRKEETPRTMLGSQGRLGWTTWLNTSIPEADPDNLVLSSGR
jgi:type VI secretion system protein ImpH